LKPIASMSGALSLLLVLVTLSGRAAGAEEGSTSQRSYTTDGAYGRLEGDLDLRIGAGLAVAKGGPSLAAGASALYMSTAGIYVQYADALGGDGPAVVRSIATGIALEPLYLARYATDLERGPARGDLLLDSILIQLGAYWDTPRGGAFARDPGFEFALGFGVPILARATGPMVCVRGAMRLDPPSLLGPPSTAGFVQGIVSLTLTWRHIVPLHLVDAADRPSPR
jgi:hypothetical protein